MSNIVVVYKSKYGYTKKYAHWIAEKLGADIKDASRTKISDLKDYQTIIYGGGLYAGRVSGISLLTKSFHAIQNKSLYLFTVGFADVTDEKNVSNIHSMINKVLTPDMQKKIKIYHFRGGIDYQRLNIIHRGMMSMLMRMLRKKPANELSDEDKLIIDTYGKSLEFSDNTSINPFVDMIKADSRV